MPENNQGGTEQFTPIATQEDLDKIVIERLNKERKKYSDYDEVKSELARLKEESEQNRTEAERLKSLEEKFKATEAKAKALEQEKQLSEWKSDVAKRTGIPADALRGESKEDLEAHAEILKEAFKKTSAPRLKDDGRQPGEAGNDESRQMVRELFGH